jgi:aspartate kinase
VEYARRYNVPLRVRSSYNDKPGSLVTGSIEEIPLENAIITGVAHDRSEAKITVTDVPDSPGMAARIFRTVADADINIDMVLQNVSRTSDRLTDITFSLPRTDGERAVAALTAVQGEIGFAEVLYDAEVGKVSLIGAGMRSHPGVTATFCEALSQAGINIETMNTSEIRISVICRVEQLDDAVRALHKAFDLGADEVAVVHGGTGR